MYTPSRDSLRSKQDILAVTTHLNYVLALLKGRQRSGVRFSCYIIFSQEDYEIIVQKARDGQAIDLSGYKDNILMELRGHEITESNRRSALDLFAKHFSGYRSSSPSPSE